MSKQPVSASQLIVSLVYIPKDTKRIYAYPPLQQNSPYLLDKLPSYAFPDVVSNPTYFIIPSTQPAMRLFGISMVYRTHALVLLTHSLYFQTLTIMLKGYYTLFVNPTPQLLVSIYNSMKCCTLSPDIMVPHPNLIGFLPKLMKLMLLPYKTVVYSSKASDCSISLLYLLTAIPGCIIETNDEANKAFGFPLEIDSATHPIIPYLPIELIDKLIGVDGYIIGASHPVFSELAIDWDVVINLDTNKCICKKEIQSILNDTREDRLMLIRLKELTHLGDFLQIIGYIERYYQGLLCTASPFSQRVHEISWNEVSVWPVNDYGLDFLKEWFVSASFQKWKETVVVDKALKYSHKHPGRPLSDSAGIQFVETITAYMTFDWMIKTTVTLNNLYLNISESIRSKPEENYETTMEEHDGPVFTTDEIEDIVPTTEKKEEEPIVEDKSSESDDDNDSDDDGDNVKDDNVEEVIDADQPLITNEDIPIE